MVLKTEAETREWARAKCEAWNWNANVADIARELIEDEIDPNSSTFVVLGEEFVRFFEDSMVSGQARLMWEIVGQIVEEFA